MKKKNGNGKLIGWAVALIVLVTGAASFLTWGIQNGALPELQRRKDKPSQPQAAVFQEESGEEALEKTVDVRDTIPYTEEELLRTANTMGENFGIITSQGTGEFTTDPYCPAPVYVVTYPNGEVAVNAEKNTLFWLERYDVKTEENRLTSQEVTKKAKEYFATLQLEQEYKNIARQPDKERHKETVVFQKVIGEEIYSDYEAVKMIISTQSGELMFCKIFDLPLKEQEGVKITQEAAIAVSKEEEPKSFQNSPRVQAVLTAAAPESFYEGDSSYDYTSCLAWKITVTSGEGKERVFYIDAYSGSVIYVGGY